MRFRSINGGRNRFSWEPFTRANPAGISAPNTFTAREGALQEPRDGFWRGVGEKCVAGGEE